MPGETDIALMAHLMRRAGFGAVREEVERRAEGVRSHGGGVAEPGGAASV